MLESLNTIISLKAVFQEIALGVDKHPYDLK